MYLGGGKWGLSPRSRFRGTTSMATSFQESLPWQAQFYASSVSGGECV